MPRPARASPERILAAAALEFSERGFAGARVDRIARRARVNKAMLYYHFGSKEAMYRTLLRQVFTRAAERLRAIGSAGTSPAEQLDAVIAGMAAFLREHAFFAPIMLRELAEGGARLDRATLGALAGVPAAVHDVVNRGIGAGVFRPVHPMAAYFSMLAPIVVYLAGAPIRREVAAQHSTLPDLEPDAFVRHMQDTMRRALAAQPVSAERRSG